MLSLFLLLMCPYQRILTGRISFTMSSPFSTSSVPQVVILRYSSSYISIGTTGTSGLRVHFRDFGFTLLIKTCLRVLQRVPGAHEIFIKKYLSRKSRTFVPFCTLSILLLVCVFSFCCSYRPFTSRVYFKGYVN